MTDALMQLHFLRPWALIITLFGVLLALFWHRTRRNRDSLQQIIAPHLLQHLRLKHTTKQRWLPIHAVSLMLVLGGLAVAGPSWDRALPPFVDEQTRVSLIIDLSASMGSDQGQHTLALAQDRILTLAKQNPGWYLGLIGYGQSAHLILPHSRDRDLFELYLNSLEPGMIPGSERNIDAALRLSLTKSKNNPTSLILVTDQLDSTQLNSSYAESLPGGSVLILAPQATLATDTAAGLLEQLSADSRAFSTRDADVHWLQDQIESHFSHRNNQNKTWKWRDYGYWLVWPALLLSLISVRKGWQVQWCLLPLALLLSPPPIVQAGTLTNAFLTPDQQGRIAFESGRYSEAARRFQSPYLRGLSAYRAADFQAAIDNFRQLDSANAWFYLGNSYAKQLRLDKAQIAYQTALKKEPDFPAATANLALVKQMLSNLNQDRQHAPNMSADSLSFDQQGNEGQVAQIQENNRLTDAVWLQNLSTSATHFLRRKFALEQKALERHDDEN